MPELTKEKLSEMYTSMDNKDVCKKLNITNPTLVSLLKRNNITLKGKGNRSERYKVTIVD